MELFDDDRYPTRDDLPLDCRLPLLEEAHSRLGQARELFKGRTATDKSWTAPWHAPEADQPPTLDPGAPTESVADNGVAPSGNHPQRPGV